MAAYFVYRANDAGPACKHLHRVEADSILDVFRANWVPVGDPSDPDQEGRVYRHGEAVFGPGYKCGLDSVAFHYPDHRWPVPTSPRELQDVFRRLADDRQFDAFDCGPHHLQFLDNDDVYQFALYAFDDRYVAEHPDRVAFLLHEPWELPDGAAERPFVPRVECEAAPKGLEGDGYTFAACLWVEDHYGLVNLPHSHSEVLRRIEGVRLPDLPRYLFTLPPPGDEECHRLVRNLADGLLHFADHATGDEAVFLKAVRVEPQDALQWGVYSDWLEDRGHPPAGERVGAELIRRCPPSRWNDAAERPNDLVSARRHVLQACKYLNNEPEYYHVVVFDDVWAAAHPDLANSILRFASRWDVL